MPKYEDLELIRNTLLNVADEIEILQSRGLTPKTIELPEEVDPSLLAEESLVSGIADELSEDIFGELSDSGGGDDGLGDLMGGEDSAAGGLPEDDGLGDLLGGGGDAGLVDIMGGGDEGAEFIGESEKSESLNFGSKELPEATVSDEVEETVEVTEVLEKLGLEADSYSDLNSLDNLLSDKQKSAGKQSDINPSEIDDLFSEGSDDSKPKKNQSDSFQDVPDFDLNDLGMGGLDDLASSTSDDLTSDFDLGDLSLDADTQKESPYKKEDDLGFDLSDISELSLSDDASSSDDKDEDGDFGTLDDLALSGRGDAAVEELGSDDYSELEEESSSSSSDSGEFLLTEEQRKKVILTLSSLPHEAEKKIATALINKKYSDKQVKPLVMELIKGKSVTDIIRQYEKLTGDTSLSHVHEWRKTGAELEEEKTSFFYNLKKNIMPVVGKAAATLLLIVAIFALFRSIVIPTMRATHHYKKGLEYLDNNVRLEGEEHFQIAYRIQPRFKETIQYARKYRDLKYYMSSEEKYLLGLSMKPGHLGTMIEYGHLLRERNDYERAISTFNEILEYRDKNIDAMLGIAETYMDWSEEQKPKIEMAREAYLDVIELEGKNKKAVFGLFRIHVIQKNYQEAMKHYNFVKNNLKGNIDPKVFTEFAGFLIDIGELETAREALRSANEVTRGKINMPEIDYQYSRYKKAVGLIEEQFKHLEDTVAKLNYMKDNEPLRFESPEYRSLLANAYNDLGEYYHYSKDGDILAERYYIDAIEVDPTFGKAYYNLGEYNMMVKRDYENARDNYLIAEQKGFSNDNMVFRLGWLDYRSNDYYNAYTRINSLADKYPSNNNLKFFIGTILYKLEKFDLAESILFEGIRHFEQLAQLNAPLSTDVNNHRIILDNLTMFANNLGAVYQRKYENTRNSEYLVRAMKYYADSAINFNKATFEEQYSPESGSEGLGFSRVSNGDHNLKLVFQPYSGVREPLIFEFFPINFVRSL